MTSLLLIIVVALATFFFADSIFTPLLLLLWKKSWLLLLKIQSLFTKKNLLQAFVQSLLFAAKAILRLVNKTVTGWILPLLMTRRQRYWLHHTIEDIRRWVRMRLLRGWVRWRRQPRWMKIATLIPAVIVTLSLFVASGFFLAALFGVSFIVPWLGGLPVATVLFLRRQLARAALYFFESMGVGPVVNRFVDRAIDLFWWRTPEPVQRRFDAWWRKLRMRLRRWVIGPRRKVVKRMAGLRFGRRASSDPPAAADAGSSDNRSEVSDMRSCEQQTPPA